MNGSAPSNDKAIRMTFNVTGDEQALELNDAWEKIVSGRRERATAAAVDLEEIMERARLALVKIAKAIADHPGTGQSRRLTHFLAGLYNGHEFAFDLGNLRALDCDLAQACIDYLNYDRLGQAEVHTHLAGGCAQLGQWVDRSGIVPQLHLSQGDEHQERLGALVKRLGRERDDLLAEALNHFFARHEARLFGCLEASAAHPSDAHPLIHARRLAESTVQPLCGAVDGPWTAQPFEFTHLSCRACKDAFSRLS